MANVRNTITATKRTTVARSALAAGAVFAMVDKAGKLMTERYAALGHNGKWYSINLKSGELASTSSGGKKVSQIGSFQIVTTLTPADQHVRKARKDVASDEVFKVVGRDLDERKSYLSLGKLADGRFTSVDLNKPFGEDYAVTDEGNKQVVVVGKWSIDARIVA